MSESDGQPGGAAPSAEPPLTWTEWIGVGADLYTILIPTAGLILAIIKRRALIAFLKRCCGIKDPPPPISRPKREVIGRAAEMAELGEILAAGKVAVVIPDGRFVGGGGYGKTTLALHYLDRHCFGPKPRYDRHAVIAAGTRTKLEAGLAKLGRDNQVVDENAPLSQQADAARAFLQQNSISHRWLLVLDNVEAREEVENQLPSGARLHVILTSRSTLWDAAPYAPVVVGLLSAADAVALLCQEAQREPDEEAEALAALFDGHPLGLVQAGELCHRRNLSFATYRKELPRLIDDFPTAGTELGDYPQALGATLNRALEEVTADERRLLQVYAFLDPDSVDRDLIEKIGTLPWLARFRERYRPVPWWVWRMARSERRRNVAFDGLIARDLLEEKGDGYRIHRLTQAVVRARLGQGAEYWAKAAAAVIAASFPNRVSSNHTVWPACARLMPHVSALAGLGDHVPRTAAMDYLCNQASIYLREQAEFAGAARFAEVSLEIATERLPENHRDLGVGYAVLGLALQDLGELDRAEKALAEAVRIAEANTEISDTDRAASLNNHGSVLQALGQRAKGAGDAETADGFFRRAEQRYLAALDLGRQTFGERHEKIATRLNNLANLYVAMGRIEDALANDAQALSIRRERLDPKDPRLARSCNNHGGKLLEVGEVDKAAPLLREALEIREHHFGHKPWHPHLLATAQWRASCLVALDDLGAPGGAELERLER
ncbi:MAG: tetratricopeptide repeat protein, partial [Pseudomonadota bacterium]